MIRSPIPRVLSTFLKYRVKSLLIGGQACILYGAAEFSRDIDLAVMVNSENLENLRLALDGLDAKSIYVPDLSEDVLLRGHACHFRCQREDVKSLRIDIISIMRGVDTFAELWKRREEIELSGIGPELLFSLAAKYPDIVSSMVTGRPLLRSAIEGNQEKTQSLLRDEEDRERDLDRQYWDPLKAELETWRFERREKKIICFTQGNVKVCSLSLPDEWQAKNKLQKANYSPR